MAARDQRYQSNFVELGNYKVIYRRYAGLFFCIVVDESDNELFYLEAIHLFVEVLDTFFGNVCELDLVFNFYKVYAILDEVFLAGELEETSKRSFWLDSRRLTRPVSIYREGHGLWRRRTRARTI